MMDTQAFADAHGATSRLRIHADSSSDGFEREGFRAMSAVWRRWWVRVRGGPALCTLEVRDLPGHRLLTLSNAGSLIDMVLPTGTYQVTTQTGESLRRYTVVLERDVITELHLQPLTHRSGVERAGP